MARKSPNPTPPTPAASPAPTPPASSEETLEIAAEPAPAPDPPPELLSADPDFAADEAELGIDGEECRWHLSRRLPKGKGYETCTSYPAGQGAITADVIREDWGPGTYYAILRAPNGQTRKHRIFTLAAPRTAFQHAPAPAGAAPAADLAGVLREIAAENRRGLEQLAQSLQARPAATSPEVMLDLALRMAERMAPKERAGGRGMLEEVAAWFGLAEKFRSGGKDWFDVLDKGIDTVKPLIDVTVSNLGGAAPAPGNGGQPAAAAAETNKQPAVEAPPMLKLANFLQRQVRYLVPKAINKSSPNLYAELLLDNLPEGVDANQVLAALKQPGSLDRLFSMLPNDDRIAAQGQRPWFEELLRELIDMLETSLASETGAAGEGDTTAQNSDTPGA